MVSLNRKKVQQQLDEYENENNPIKAFIEDNGIESIENEATADVYIQFMGREVYTKNILSNVRRIWTDELGKKEKDLKDIKIYIKPEENKAYYVINGDITGSVWI